jgi:GAF domain-containing protein
MTGDDLRAAVAAGVLRSEEGHRELLRSIVEVARAIFHARAASIFLLDEERDELVFEAISGEGSDSLVGTRFPSSTGIAGWVLVTRQPLVLDDVSEDPRFAKDAAEATGFVPKGLMAVPLLHEERALGVLEVLDRPVRPGAALEDVELLGLFAAQAAIALDLLQAARRARAALEGSGADLETVARLAAAIDGLEDERRAVGLELLASLDKLLSDESRAAGPPGSPTRRSSPWCDELRRPAHPERPSSFRALLPRFLLSSTMRTPSNQTCGQATIFPLFRPLRNSAVSASA